MNENDDSTLLPYYIMYFTEKDRLIAVRRVMAVDEDEAAEMGEDTIPDKAVDMFVAKLH
jgi:hypothetical protein